jgi:hypothetical protein
MRKLIYFAPLLFALPLFAAPHIFSVASTAALRTSPQFIVAGAGSVAGANGTFFHSDITLTNYRSVDQMISLQWLPAGAMAGTPMTITVRALSGIISEDFVADVLHVSGLGSILITGVNADGTPDPLAQLYVTERVWTPQPGSTGTDSQTFPVIATSDVNVTRATILGQRIDSRYRTNVGIVNYDSTAARSFDIIQTTDDSMNPTVTTTVTVPASSMIQVPLANAATTVLQIAVVPRDAINPALWLSYGSSVDNVTGDSWSSLGFQSR